MKPNKQVTKALAEQSKKKVPANVVLKTYKRILGYVKRHWVFFIIGIIGTILSAGIDAGLTWSLKPLLDKGFIDHNQQFISLLPFMVLAAFFLRGFASFLSGFFIQSVGRNVVMQLRKEIFDKLLLLPSRYYDKSTTGEILSKLIYNVDQVSAASASSLIMVVRESFFIIGLLIVMFSISWRLSSLFFLVAPFIAITASYSSSKMRRYGRRLQNGMGDLTQIAEEAISGYKVIRTFGGGEYERDKFYSLVKHNRRREMQLIATNQLASPIVQLIVSVIIAITIYMSITSVGTITAGGFASILAAMLAIIKPLKNITNVNNVIQRGVVGAEGIFELLDKPEEIDQGKHTIDRVKGLVEYRQVNFAYDEKEKTVLHDINLLVEPRQTVAIVGKSGGGKTTLVSLLPRFYDNYQGEILIDSVNVKDFTLENLRHQFALVSQHVTLFNDTVAKNIAYGKATDVSLAEITAAAKTAHALEFIKDLPDGFDTIIGEGGVLLSGGQRQRLALARAVLKNAPILILDEATSALDSESELYIQDAMQRLMKDRTTLVIAHRLSTIENADKIIVVEQGRIVEVGTHKELLKLGKHYAKLYHMQFKEKNFLKPEDIQATPAYET
ncbi:MAG: lipid A export permease/ATP-binding protein MsbA [Pseudomonadota bacterium]